MFHIQTSGEYVVDFSKNKMVDSAFYQAEIRYWSGFCILDNTKYLTSQSAVSSGLACWKHLEQSFFGLINLKNLAPVWVLPPSFESEFYHFDSLPGLCITFYHLVLCNSFINLILLHSFTASFVTWFKPKFYQLQLIFSRAL